MAATDSPTSSTGDGSSPELPLHFNESRIEQAELAISSESEVTWQQRASLLEKEITAKKAENSRYAGRNLLIVQMWSDRDRSDRGALAKICRYAKTNKSVVQWVLKMARKGAYDRLVLKARAGRRGKRQQVLEALRNGIPPVEVERQFHLHRTTVLRACHQLKTLGGRAAA